MKETLSYAAIYPAISATRRGHIVLLLQKIKEAQELEWYVRKALQPVSQKFW